LSYVADVCGRLPTAKVIRSLRRLAVPALAFAFAILASATPQAAEWKQLRSPHFELYTTVSAGAAKDALRYFENIYDFFDRFMQMRPDPPARVRIVMFSSDKEFGPYRPAKTADAYYQSGLLRETIVIGDFTEQAHPTIVHEYTHLLINQLDGEFPLWLNEGLAEFFSTFDRSGKDVLVGRHSPGRLYAYQTDRLLSIPRLLVLDQASPEFRSEESVGMVYAESWALTHMIMLDERYRPKSAGFLRLVAGGTSAADAFDKVYGRTLNQVEGDLAAHFAGRTVPMLRMALPAFVPPELTAVPASDVDVRAALAEIGLSFGTEAANRQTFDQIGSGGVPSLTELEAHALLEWRYGKIEDATRYLKAAVQAGSDLPMVRALAAIFEARAALAQNTPERAIVILNADERPPRDAAFMHYETLVRAHIMLTDYRDAVADAAKLTRAASRPGQRAAAASAETEARGPAEMAGVVTGRLQRFSCDGPQPVLEVLTAAGVLRFVIDDRTKVAAPSTKPPQLACGPQDRQIRVGYSFANPLPGVDGRVRLIDLR
jgi:hypothetical protein